MMKQMQGVNQNNALMNPDGSITALGNWVCLLYMQARLELMSIVHLERLSGGLANEMEMRWDLE